MTYWDKDTIQLVQSLNDKLKIDHSKWHKDKGNKYKRSAELISAGLCHLIISCNENETIEYIRPAVQADGGDIKLASVNDGVVNIEMLGACQGCPLSIATLKSGIERILLDKVPGVVEVIAT